MEFIKDKKVSYKGTPDEGGWLHQAVSSGMDRFKSALKALNNARQYFFVSKVNKK